MVPQYEKTQYNPLGFSHPLLQLFQHSEGENGEDCDAVSEFGLACNIPPILPNPPSINILVALLCAVL